VRVGAAHLPALATADAEALIADGTISGGMVLKVRTALTAVRAGIPEVVIAGRARLTGGFAGTRLLTAAAAQVAS